MLPTKQYSEEPCTYDFTNRLVQRTTAIGPVTFAINPFGQRYQKTSTLGTTEFHYDKDGRLISETGSDGQPIRQYIYLGDLPVAVVQNGQLYYIHADHLNTPRLITSQAGATMWRWDPVEPFGVTPPNENPGNPSGIGSFEFPLRYPGQYYDKETNLHYNMARDYDPATGRYVQSDPIGLRGGVNTYAYVGGNPLLRTDPRGLETTVITTYDYGIGSHSALYVNTPGKTPFLYDPAGSFQPSGEPRGTGGFFEGSQANLQNYILYQRSLGSTIELVKIPTTPSQEKAIRDQAINIGDPRGFSCASAVSQALGGVCKIPGSFFPGNLRRQAEGAQCKP